MVLVFVMPIGLENIGWKMYMVNGSWDIIVIVLIVSLHLLCIHAFQVLVATGAEAKCNQAVYWIETKNKSLEEIDALFEGQKHSSVPDVEKVRLGVETIDVGKVETQIQTEIGAVKAK